MRTAYRRKPRAGAKAWTGIVGGALVLLGAPAALDLVVPEAAPVMTRVEFGSEDEGWTIGMKDRDESDLVCRQHFDDPMTERWSCDGTDIRTTVVENAQDENLALRRIIRGVGAGPSVLDDTVPITRHGHVRAVNAPQDGATAVSVEGTGDHRDHTVMVVVSGPERAEYTDLIWQNLTTGGRS